MKSELPYEQILLYWSDELDERARANTESLLAVNPEAQAYLDELCELDALGADLPAIEPSFSRATAALAAVEDLERSPVNSEPSHARSFGIWTFVSALAIAAAILFGSLLIWPTGGTGDPVDSLSEVEPKPSEILFSSRQYFKRPAASQKNRYRIIRQRATATRDIEDL